MKWQVPVFVLVSCFGATLARADLPPPDGKKQVSYSFQVKGLGAHAEWVLLVHPYPVYDAGATQRFERVEDGKAMRVDRRNGSPKLYAMKKPGYEQWLAKYRPVKDGTEDPALDALFKSDQVVACSPSPQPVNLLDKSDPRSEVVEAFVVKSIDAKSCVLQPDTGGTPVAPVSAAAPVPPLPSSTPVLPASGPTSTVPERERAPQHSGCGGCAISTRDGARDGALSMIALLGLLGWRRRGRA